ncbi:MAG: Fe-S oxidoreductase, partial [Sphingobacteriia bacterium]
MQYIEQLAFALLLVLSLGFFARTFYKIIRNIGLGRSEPMDRSLGTMLRVALGQQKMVVRPIPAALHLCVYLGFLIINIEIVEIILDGLLGTQRILGGLLGPVYSLVTAGAEVFFLLALLATVIFLLRRNVLKLRRFSGTEMSSWPRLDANIILWTEIVLILA